MIRLEHDSLVFAFPDVHPDAVLRIDFKRTLRIPDDGSTYFLPPGLGSFPLRSIDDQGDAVPPSWRRRGGVMMPMHQAEAMWLDFDSPSGYPFAVKIAAGRVDAVTGEGWSDKLHRRPQDYVVVPEQPWLDGFCVEKGVIRQFVAMPLGDGYSVEEQLTGRADHGGLQLLVRPMRAEAWERLKKERESTRSRYADIVACCESPAMGLAPGGRMKQAIARDPHRFDDWDTERSSRCWLHIANAPVWRAITGEAPPMRAPTAAQYNALGLPWFDWYDWDAVAVEGSDALARVRSALEMARLRDDPGAVPDDEPVAGERVVVLGRPVRIDEGAWS